VLLGSADKKTGCELFIDQLFKVADSAVLPENKLLH